MVAIEVTPPLIAVEATAKLLMTAITIRTAVPAGTAGLAGAGRRPVGPIRPVPAAAWPTRAVRSVPLLIRPVGARGAWSVGPVGTGLFGAWPIRSVPAAWAVGSIRPVPSFRPLGTFGAGLFGTVPAFGSLRPFRTWLVRPVPAALRPLGWITSRGFGIRSFWTRAGAFDHRRRIGVAGDFGAWTALTLAHRAFARGRGRLFLREGGQRRSQGGGDGGDSGEGHQ
ncbi:MAG: hypothetical protein DI531_11285 [Brevundimonas sp.]|nr:MAG: hypothetical protein DI531_11285 [Brevundimonas sp.]